MTDYRFRISRVGGRVQLWIPGPLDVDEARFLAEQIIEFCDSPDSTTVVWGGEPGPPDEDRDEPNPGAQLLGADRTRR